MSDWVDICRAAAGTRDTRYLNAFDRSDQSVGVQTLEGLIERCVVDQQTLLAAIPKTLSAEVDAPQASLFARRFDGVWRLAEQLPETDAALLRVGLVRRTTEVLADEAPRALRVRAVADFYYSVAARILHRGSARAFAEAVADTEWTRVEPGIRHGVLRGPGPVGPLSVNLLEVRGRTLEAVDCRPQGDLVEAVRRAGAVAGVSGGFFLYSEPDIERPSRRTDPVGLLVQGGVVMHPPVFRRAAVSQHHDGSVHLGPQGLTGTELQVEGNRYRVDRVNRAGEGVGAWTRARSTAAPVAGPQVVGRQVVGFGRDIPLAGLVLEGLTLEVGAVIDWKLPGGARTAMAGGPMLIGPGALDRAAEDFAGTAPPVTFSQDETYDQNLLPRMAVGKRDDTLLFAAIDGRDLHRAPGLTLRGTADLLRALGCVTAMNLDGGSSKRMVVAGRVVDRPSTEMVTDERPTRIRPVHTAILIS